MEATLRLPEEAAGGAGGRDAHRLRLPAGPTPSPGDTPTPTASSVPDALTSAALLPDWPPPVARLEGRVGAASGQPLPIRPHVLRLPRLHRLLGGAPVRADSLPGPLSPQGVALLQLLPLISSSSNTGTEADAAPVPSAAPLGTPAQDQRGSPFLAATSGGESKSPPLSEDISMATFRAVSNGHTPSSVEPSPAGTFPSPLGLKGAPGLPHRCG